VKWPTVQPAGSLQRGTFNTPDHIQDMSRRMHQEISRGTFNLFPTQNAPSGNRGQRTNPLGAFQSGDKKLGRQNYDVRFNVHICKYIILSWGRNAYTSDTKKGGAPIAVSYQGQLLSVSCHIDITTPRDNMLWHGIEGPHVVIEGYKLPNGTHPHRYFKPRNSTFEITPNDLFKLYIWERDNNAGRAMNDPARTWPDWLLERLGRGCITG
jgi:hypothetical protein